MSIVGLLLCKSKRTKTEGSAHKTSQEGFLSSFLGVAERCRKPQDFKQNYDLSYGITKFASMFKTILYIFYVVSNAYIRYYV